jgi:hypothetical protein
VEPWKQPSDLNGLVDDYLKDPGPKAATALGQALLQSELRHVVGPRCLPAGEGPSREESCGLPQAPTLSPQARPLIVNRLSFSRALRFLALALADGLRSLARLIAEWAGVHKRIEIIVRNPGFEGTEQALGSLSMDFEDAAALETAISVMNSKLMSQGKTQPRSIAFHNERLEILGFNPEYYVSHRISDVAGWQSPWILPSQGAPAPPREAE